MSDQELYYRPARSVVAVTGTVTITTEADGDQSQSITSEVTLATEADVNARWKLELKEGISVVTANLSSSLPRTSASQVQRALPQASGRNCSQLAFVSLHLQ